MRVLINLRNTYGLSPNGISLLLFQTQPTGSSTIKGHFNLSMRKVNGNSDVLTDFDPNFGNTIGFDKFSLQAPNWVVGDQFLNYDPCVCMQASAFAIEVLFIQTSKVNLDINGTSSVLFSPGSPAFDPNALNLSTKIDGGTKVINSAQQSFNSGLGLKKYADDFIKGPFQDYTESKTLVKIMRGLSEAIPYASAAITAFDTFVGLFSPKPAVPPTYQTTDYKLKASGTIGLENKVFERMMANPFSSATTNSSILTPTYSAPLGLIAVLEKPKVQFVEWEPDFYKVERHYQYLPWDKRIVTTLLPTIREYRLQEPIKYAVNPTSDMKVASVQVALVPRRPTRSDYNYHIEGSFRNSFLDDWIQNTGKTTMTFQRDFIFFGPVLDEYPDNNTKPLIDQLDKKDLYSLESFSKSEEEFRNDYSLGRTKIKSKFYDVRVAGNKGVKFWHFYKSPRPDSCEVEVVFTLVHKFNPRIKPVIIKFSYNSDLRKYNSTQLTYRTPASTNQSYNQGIHYDNEGRKYLRISVNSNTGSQVTYQAIDGSGSYTISYPYPHYTEDFTPNSYDYVDAIWNATPPVMAKDKILFDNINQLGEQYNCSVNANMTINLKGSYRTPYFTSPSITGCTVFTYRAGRKVLLQNGYSVSSRVSTLPSRRVNFNLSDETTVYPGSPGFVSSWLNESPTSYICDNLNSGYYQSSNRLNARLANPESPTAALKSKLDFDVYPNPSDGNITLSAPFDLSQATYELTTISGKIVHTGQVSDYFQPTGQSYVGQLNQAPGIYFMKISGADFSSVKRLVIQ